MSVRPVAKPVSEGPMARTLAGERTPRPPLWLMRQAGRFLPEYREIRAKVPAFLDLCFDPKLASEVTLQPIRRFGFDAAILFSDILVVPHALGQAVTFEAGEGPRLPPIVSPEDLGKLAERVDLDKLSAVFETIERVKAELGQETALLGFCGAPWTVASYMVAGQGTPDQRPARLLAYAQPALFSRLIDLLVEASTDYLDRQLAAGVDAVQIFDSWAGVLPDLEFETWCLEPVRRIIAGLRARRSDARVIVFSRVGSEHLVRVARESGADVVGLDTTVPAGWAAADVQSILPVQGNLDPLQLIAGGAGLDRAIDHILDAFAGGPHIFNLGHGILPETPIHHVEQLVRRVRARG